MATRAADAAVIGTSSAGNVHNILCCVVHRGCPAPWGPVPPHPRIKCGAGSSRLPRRRPLQNLGFPPCQRGKCPKGKGARASEARRTDNRAGYARGGEGHTNQTPTIPSPHSIQQSRPIATNNPLSSPRERARVRGNRGQRGGPANQTPCQPNPHHPILSIHANSSISIRLTFILHL